MAEVVVIPPTDSTMAAHQLVGSAQLVLSKLRAGVPTGSGQDAHRGAEQQRSEGW